MHKYAKQIEPELLTTFWVMAQKALDLRIHGKSEGYVDDRSEFQMDTTTCIGLK